MKYLKEYINFEEDWEEEDENIYKDYPEDFKQFLINNDALESFHKNFNQYFLYQLNNKLFFSNIKSENWISLAFNWSKINNPIKWMQLHDLWSSKITDFYDKIP